MRFAIVDDENVFANNFSMLIKEKFFNDLDSLDIFSSGDDLKSSKEVYDVLFLDIDMPNVSGIEIAKEYLCSDTMIVFVTNRDDMVFDAFNTTKSIGFVRKTKLESDLKAVIDRINRELQSDMFFSVKNGGTLTKVKYSEIIYIEKISHNIVVHTEKRALSIRKNISETEEMLRAYGFVRTHVGFIVNLEYIELINSKGVLLSNGTLIPISRQNLKFVKDEFLKRSVMLNE